MGYCKEHNVNNCAMCSDEKKLTGGGDRGILHQESDDGKLYVTNVGDVFKEGGLTVL